MNMNKDYFLARLANGEDMDTIGQEMAAMMNAAIAEHNARIEAEKAKAAEADKEAAKRDLIEEIVEIVQELAILEGFNEDEITITAEDMDNMVAAFTEMFNAMREVKKLVASLEEVKPAKPVAKPKVTAIKTDDEALAEFVKMLGL